MAKIFKAYQVKMEKEKIPIPTGQKPPPRPMTAEEEEEAIFQALGPDQLTGGGKVSIDKSALPPEEGAPGAAEAPPESPAAVGAPPAGSPAAGAPAAGTPPAGRPAGKPGHAPGTLGPDFRATSPTHGLPADDLSPSATAGRVSSFKAALQRRELELAALEQRLREWEAELLQRESGLSQQEDRLHQEMLQRRQGLEEDSAKIVDMARKSAEQLAATARAEAESLRKAAKLEAEEAKNRGYKEGHALGEEKGISAGEKAGLEEMRFDWQNLMQEAETLIQELQSSRIGLLKAAEEEMVHLVIAFAKKVLKVEPLIRPEIILKNLDAALNKVGEVDRIVLRINLKDKSMTESHKDEFLRRLSAIQEVKVLEDPALAPGGIKIETSVGTIDATIESQAHELELALLKYLRTNDQVFK